MVCNECKKKLVLSEEASAEKEGGKYYHHECLELRHKRYELYKYISNLFHFKSETKVGPVILNQIKIFMNKMMSISR